MARTIPAPNENDVAAAEQLATAENRVQLIAQMVAEIRWLRNLMQPVDGKVHEARLRQEFEKFLKETQEWVPEDGWNDELEDQDTAFAAGVAVGLRGFENG